MAVPRVTGPNMRFTRLTLASAALVFALVNPAHASMLTLEFQIQLESWLGSSLRIVVTPLFVKATGDGKTSGDFHVAVDGRGPTITLIEVLSNFSDSFDPYPIPKVIGGFNPRSWNAEGIFHRTPEDIDRTAFLFNLSDRILQRQRLTTDHYWSEYGLVQTYNGGNYGPVFGLGNDLCIDSSLSSGFLAQYSYGSPGSPQSELNSNLLGNGYPGQTFSDIQIGQMAVYRVLPIEGRYAVPEPASASLCGMGIMGLLLGRCRRRVSARQPLTR